MNRFDRYPHYVQFTLEITGEALEDLEFFDKAAQVIILDETEILD